MVFHPVLQISRVGGLWNREAFSWFSDFAGNSWAHVSALYCHPRFDHQAKKHGNGWSQPTLALLGHLLAPSELLLLPAATWWLSAHPVPSPGNSTHRCSQPIICHTRERGPSWVICHVGTDSLTTTPNPKAWIRWYYFRHQLMGCWVTFFSSSYPKHV